VTGGTLLEVRDLQTHFRASGGTLRAVDGVSFDILPGQSVGLVGESGSGKSVTAMSIMRLIKRPGEIVGGHVLFKGVDLLKASDSQMQSTRGKSICLVPQESMSALNPVYTVGRQMRETLQTHQRVNNDTAMKEAVRLLSLVRIPAPVERLRSYPHVMSGGMLQRVTIAMALANDPELLILDEPTTALDVTIQAQVLELIRDLRSRVDAAILLITHDLGVVSEACDEAIVMYGGKVMERAPVADLVETPRHPYTVGLVESVSSLESGGHRLSAIPGSIPNPLAMPPGCPFAPRCKHVMSKCQEMPPIQRMEDGRDVACWLYSDD
jgi:oligopeptide/dipeptide ABC transporter ATP-binding protein